MGNRGNRVTIVNVYNGDEKDDNNGCALCGTVAFFAVLIVGGYYGLKEEIGQTPTLIFFGLIGYGVYAAFFTSKKKR